MPRIILARERQHEQIEFPVDIPHPEGRRGGRQTSLHLRRGSVRDVTHEELEYIRVNHPDVFRCLDVLPEPRKSKALARALKARAEAVIPKSDPKVAARTSKRSRAKKTKSEG